MVLIRHGGRRARGASPASEGPYVYDIDGKRYLDSMAGLWCASLGFADQRLADAAYRAYQNLGYYHSFGGRASPAAIEAAETIAGLVPIDNAHVFFATSGSETIETMVKLAWLHFLRRGETARRKIIARDRAFHGSTIFAASLTGLPHMHREFGLPLTDIVRVGCPDPYRGKQPKEDDDTFSTRLANELEETILREGPDTIAAFIAEPINAGAGVIIPPAGYFPKIQAVLRKHGILFLADEVVCGFCRTGEWFGSQSLAIRPDMMAMAKGISSSYFPISAVALSEEIYDSVREINSAGANFGHGFTNSGHPVGAAIVNEVIRIYKEMNATERVQELGKRILASAVAELGDIEIVGDIRGKGLLIGVEIVEDREAKLPFPADRGVPLAIEQAAMKRGLILRPQGNTITLCPPVIISDAQADEVVDTISAVLRSLPR